MVRITRKNTKPSKLTRSIFYTPRYSYFEITLIMIVYTVAFLFQHPLIAFMILVLGMTISIVFKMYANYHDYIQKHPVGKYHM